MRYRAPKALRLDLWVTFRTEALERLGIVSTPLARLFTRAKAVVQSHQQYIRSATLAPKTGMDSPLAYARGLPPNARKSATPLPGYGGRGVSGIPNPIVFLAP
jgi:hypothetical protein